MFLSVPVRLTSPTTCVCDWFRSVDLVFELGAGSPPLMLTVLPFMVFSQLSMVTALSFRCVDLVWFLCLSSLRRTVGVVNADPVLGRV